jgi:hypothetical protein
MTRGSGQTFSTFSGNFSEIERKILVILYTVKKVNARMVRGVGCARPPPFILFTITYDDAVCAPAERADTVLSPYLISTLYVLCGSFILLPSVTITKNSS